MYTSEYENLYIDVNVYMYVLYASVLVSICRHEYVCVYMCLCPCIYKYACSCVMSVYVSMCVSIWRCEHVVCMCVCTYNTFFCGVIELPESPFSIWSFLQQLALEGQLILLIELLLPTGAPSSALGPRDDCPLVPMSWIRRKARVG